jgi:predicted kinase
MAGLPGTGKSTLAKAVAHKLSGTILSKDEIRHSIFERRDVEYSTAQDDFCMEIMLAAAEYILHKDPSRVILLDGRTFSRRYQLDRVIAFAERLGQQWRILECVCGDEAAKHRLEQPSQHPAGNRDYSLYLAVKRRFENIARPKLIVNTEESLDTSISAALQFLTE